MALAKLLPWLRPLDQALAETRADEPDGQTAGAKWGEGKGVACSEYGDKLGWTDGKPQPYQRRRNGAFWNLARTWYWCWRWR